MFSMKIEEDHSFFE